MMGKEMGKKVAQETKDMCKKNSFGGRALRESSYKEK